MFRSSSSTSTTAIKARNAELMKSFCAALEEETHKMYNAIAGCAPFGVVGNFKLPGQGEPVSTFWGGEGVEPTKSGVAIVYLLQGERDQDTKMLHPERLPGGKTAIRHVNDSLAKKDLPYAITLVFTKSTKDLDVYVVDLERLDEWKAHIARGRIVLDEGKGHIARNHPGVGVEPHPKLQKIEEDTKYPPKSPRKLVFLNNTSVIVPEDYEDYADDLNALNGHTQSDEFTPVVSRRSCRKLNF